MRPAEAAGRAGRWQITRRAWLQVALALALLGYGAVSLWPYDWVRLQLVVNAAEPLPEGGVRFMGAGVALAREAPAWIGPAMRTDRLELSLRVRSLAPEQSGPARIFTLSAGPYQRNLTIGQDGADLIVRLRTPWTDENGMYGKYELARLPGLFGTADWIDLAIVVEPRRLRIMVGEDIRVEQPLPGHPLAGWDPAHRVALGNEVTFNRPWLGEIRQAMVRTAGRIDNYAETGELDFPRMLLVTTKFPKLVPLRNLHVRDALENVVLYVPLGVLLGLLLGTDDRRVGWRSVLGAVLFIAAFSASMESLQLFVPRRAPSADDLMFNTLGGGLGLLLTLGIRRWSGAQRPG